MYTCLLAFAQLIASHPTVKVHDVTAEHCAPISVGIISPIWVTYRPKSEQPLTFLGRSTEALWSSRTLHVSTWPFCAATKNGLAPSCQQTIVGILHCLIYHNCATEKHRTLDTYSFLERLHLDCQEIVTEKHKHAQTSCMTMLPTFSSISGSC